MSKHTPGPWRIYGECYIEASSEDDHIGPLAEIRSDLAYPYSDPRVAETRAANARLIAAAPEMLDALDDIIGMAEVGRMVHVINRAKAATAKARGEE